MVRRCESWDGSSWTELTEINTARQSAVVTGPSSTSGLISAGYHESTFAGAAVTESWDGTSWSEEADLNTARAAAGGSGTTTAALAVGGWKDNASPPKVQTAVESWNGSSWSETFELNTARSQNRASGTSTDMLVSGGEPGDKTETEYFNGSSWTELSDLPTGKSSCGYSASGTSSATLVTGGPSFNAATFEWDVSESLQTLASTNA